MSYTRSPFRTRFLIKADLPEILTIERKSFGDDGWNESDFLSCLKNRNIVGNVAECGERVVGYMIYELHKRRYGLVNMVVHPAWRRRGVGKAMVAKLANGLSSHRRTKITVGVPERLLGGLLFFKAQGFIATRLIRNAFEGVEGTEDAVVMRLGHTVVVGQGGVSIDCDCGGES